MQRRQAFKYELRPKGAQVRQLRQFAGSCRYVFNRALALQQDRHAQGEKHLSYATLCRTLTMWRHAEDTAWLSAAPSQALQQKLKDLDRAYVNFFAKRAKFPRRRKRGRQDTFRYPEPKQIKLDQDNRRIFLPKLGWVRYRHSRQVLGEIKNVTVSGSYDKWYVSVLRSYRQSEPSDTGRIQMRELRL